MVPASVTADGSETSVSTAKGGSSKWPFTSWVLWAHSTPSDLNMRLLKVVYWDLFLNPCVTGDSPVKQPVCLQLSGDGWQHLDSTQLVSAIIYYTFHPQKEGNKGQEWNTCWICTPWPDIETQFLYLAGCKYRSAGMMAPFKICFLRQINGWYHCCYHVPPGIHHARLYRLTVRWLRRFQIKRLNTIFFSSQNMSCSFCSDLMHVWFFFGGRHVLAPMTHLSYCHK